MRRSLFGFLILVAIAIMGCHSDARPPTHQDDVGQVEQAVGNGVVAQKNDYMAVGYISAPDFACSAILITPMWALTAAHCVMGDFPKCWPEAHGVNDRRIEDVDIIFSNLANDPAPTFTAHHTFKKSGADDFASGNGGRCVQPQRVEPGYRAHQARRACSDIDDSAAPSTVGRRAVLLRDSGGPR